MSETNIAYKEEELKKIDTNIDIEPSTKYYALWIYFYVRDETDDPDNIKDANAISKNPNNLIELQKKELDNENSFYKNYKYDVEKIKVEPIKTYTYNSEITSFEIFCDSHICEGYNFYAIYGLPNISIFNAINSILNGNTNDILKINNAKYKSYRFEYIPEETIDHTTILLYLRVEQYDLIKNSSLIVCSSSIKPDVYYDEGIMNA